MAGVLTAGGAAEFFVGLNDVMNVIDQEVSFDWPCVTYEDRVVFWYPLGKDADVLCLPLPGKIVWRSGGTDRFERAMLHATFFVNFTMRAFFARLDGA